MSRILFLCEGQTELEFVKEVLAPHFYAINPLIMVSSRLFHTKSVPVNGIIPKGGLGSYEKVKDQILSICKPDPKQIVTTIIDFYGLPNDFACIGLDKSNGDIEHARNLEHKFEKDIDCVNFYAYFMIHEFEALLFSNPSEFMGWFDEDSVEIIQKIADMHESPEHINSGIESAPSKRLKQILHGYDKVFHGPMIASQITLETIRNKCHHFNDWITRLEEMLQIHV